MQVLLTREGIPKIADVGLSRVLRNGYGLLKHRLP